MAALFELEKETAAEPHTRKRNGAFYTPDDVVQSLVRWAVRDRSDRMLDPSCGDGRFLALHKNCVGIERDPDASGVALARVPWSTVHSEDFFSWASGTQERFECAAGNPPFIRYQRFTGETRGRALQLCSRLGADFSALTSSWAPFLVATASLLKPGGRMAFVVPAEIGHAPYARPLLDFLASRFSAVRIVAVRKKLFPDLSEDCWLLHASGYGGATDNFRFSALEDFRFSPHPPAGGTTVSLAELAAWNFRLRPFLLSAQARSAYRAESDYTSALRLGDVAKVGIGYVTGANDFFHLRPSAASRIGIPGDLLHSTIRNGRQLESDAVTYDSVERWMERDEPVLLLRLRRDQPLPKSVRKYLEGPDGSRARESYKCRNRKPWYVVPDVSVPDAFVPYMNSASVRIVENAAHCVCTNSIHAVHLNGRMRLPEIKKRWRHPLTRLSCELEGHPLGGGMLKLEPREAARVLLAKLNLVERDSESVADGIRTMKQWRHYG